VTKLRDDDEYQDEEDNNDEEEDEIWSTIKDLSEEELAEEEADWHEYHGILWEEMWEEYRARAKQGHVTEIILKVMRPGSFFCRGLRAVLKSLCSLVSSAVHAGISACVFNDSARSSIYGVKI